MKNSLYSELVGWKQNHSSDQGCGEKKIEKDQGETSSKKGRVKEGGKPYASSSASVNLCQASGEVLESLSHMGLASEKGGYDVFLREVIPLLALMGWSKNKGI